MACGVGNHNKPTEGIIGYAIGLRIRNYKEYKGTIKRIFRFERNIRNIVRTLFFWRRHTIQCALLLRVTFPFLCLRPPVRVMARSPRGTGCSGMYAGAFEPIAAALVPVRRACGRRTLGPCALAYCFSTGWHILSIRANCSGENCDLNASCLCKNLGSCCGSPSNR